MQSFMRNKGLCRNGDSTLVVVGPIAVGGGADPRGSPNRLINLRIRCQRGLDAGEMVEYGAAPIRTEAPVAQLDRALPSEGRGREFESRRVRQFSPKRKAFS